MKHDLLSYAEDPLIVALDDLQQRAKVTGAVQPLNRHQVIRFEKKQSIKRIEVQTGVVWLTSTPANGDIVLRAGDAFDFARDWPYVVEGIETAALLLR